jgi:hypothetical protein
MRKSVIAAAGALVFAAGSSSGSIADPGFVSTVVAWTGGQIIVTTSGARTSVPACGSSHPQQFAFISTTPGGKAQLAVLLTAYASGKQVRIVGSDVCDAAPNYETIDYFYTVD